MEALQKHAGWGDRGMINKHTLRKDELMRLFFAINFNNKTRSLLLGVQDEVRYRSSGGSFTLPENLHLTLVFLGECSTKQAMAAKAAMDSISIDPFDIQVERVGRFKRYDGDIWWAAVSRSKPLLDLHSELTGNLSAAGFNPEKREYKPHITLGRRVITDTSPWKVEPFGETVTRVDLMKSERIAGMLVYKAI